jgi:hypothetical protein
MRRVGSARYAGSMPMQTRPDLLKPAKRRHHSDLLGHGAKARPFGQWSGCQSEQRHRPLRFRGKGVARLTQASSARIRVFAYESGAANAGEPPLAASLNRVIRYSVYWDEAKPDGTSQTAFRAFGQPVASILRTVRRERLSNFCWMPGAESLAATITSADGCLLRFEPARTAGRIL